ncbi:MAG TPA: hypothetical protein VLA37_08230, partial [Sphingomonadaceae bacterium]|nr:hypothetical protein [Sphingomonadaceae bacterium]
MRAAKKRHAGPDGFAPGRGVHFTAEAVVLAAVLLTGLASYNREALTKLEQAYGPEDNGPVFASYQYDDADNGGTSSVFQVENQSLSWICDLRKTYEYGYCGFGVIFDQYHTGRGIELDRYESMSFTLDYEGSGQALRLAVKDKNPRYVELGALNDEKINQANIAVSPGRQTVTIDLHEFAVVEWWKEAASTPSIELSQPRFDNVVSMEFLTAADSAPGRHALRIDRIVFNGHLMSAETFFGIIAFAWLLL